jgi:hypothetical protein
LGIGDWGLGPIPNPQSPIPNPQSPIPKFLYKNICKNKLICLLNLYNYTIIIFLLTIKYILNNSIAS